MFGIPVRVWVWLGLAVAGIFAIIALNAWDNTRLEKAYSEGYEASDTKWERKEFEIIERSEEIAKRNAKELFGKQEELRQARKELKDHETAVITIYEKEINSCHPHPEYLRVWDDNAANKHSSTNSGELTPKKPGPP